MEVKKTGKYKTRDSEVVVIYGFNNPGESDKPMAEGYFESSRAMGWWDVETGKFSFGKENPPSMDIVEVFI